MPALFDQFGICFEFPENWEVDAPVEATGDVSITVSSPETAFWSFTRYQGTVDPTELLEQVLATMKDEYAFLEFETAAENVENQTMVGYDLNFFCLDLSNTARFRGFQREGTTYLLFYQAEDREMERVQPVLQAMTVSLLRNYRL
tara:strand:- start:115 stop:549 length:435 start_codon:yes stop_codon:yes gene_type:complete